MIRGPESDVLKLLKADSAYCSLILHAKFQTHSKINTINHVNGGSERARETQIWKKINQFSNKSVFSFYSNTKTIFTLHGD